MIPALDRKLFRDLWHLRGQLMAIVLVLASGISTFVATLSVLDSLEDSMQSYYQSQRFADVFAQVVRAPERVRSELERLPGVAAVETRVVADVTVDVEGTVEAITGRLVSLPDRGPPRLDAVFLRLGRLPEPGHDDEALVSEAFAEAHGLRPGDRLTVVLNERLQRLRVVGIALSPEFTYSIKPGSVFPDDRLFGILWMRRKALGTALDMDGAFNDVALTLSHGARVEQVIADLDRLLEPYGALGAYPRALQESNWYLQNEIDQLQATGLIMPAVFLLVAAFLLNVALSRLVGQQRDQIAILKAFGYSNPQVGVHFAKMVLVVVAISGLLGALGGSWMGAAMIGIYRDFFRFPSLPYVLDARYLAQALIVGSAAAFLGAGAAIRSAVRLPPAEAMRPEAPGNYRPTVVERLGLQALLSMPARMVLRNLERRPFKAAMSVLGIGMAVALLVAGNAMMDSIQFGMDTQFKYAQREDMTLTLVEPRSQDVLHDVRHLPGVQYVEGVRTVAARLRAGHRSRRIGVTGTPPDPRLQRLLDTELETFAPPPAGILLTSKLAEVLGVHTGDMLTVEVLEGRRPTVQVPIAGVVETFIGIGAYMELSYLNHVLGDGPVVNGAHLLVDENRLPELHAKLKETPVVAGVGMRKEMLRSFEETAAEHMRIMSAFMVLFAMVIACGVVYNNARIVLSERGRELASMRVLGFRRWEISAILLGELWLLTAVAIPVGLLLGYALSALTMMSMDTELFRMPLVVESDTYGIAAVVVGAASVASGLMVRRRLDRLDLVAVLKTRE